MSRFFKDDIIRKRPTYTTASDGESILQSTVDIEFKGSMQPATGGKTIVNGLNAVRVTHRLGCDVLDIINSDIIEYKSNDYRVLLVDTIFNHHMQIDLEFISG